MAGNFKEKVSRKKEKAKVEFPFCKNEFIDGPNRKDKLKRFNFTFKPDKSRRANIN